MGTRASAALLLPGLLALLPPAAGCSLFRGAAGGLASGLLQDAGLGFQRERDWDLLREALPGTLGLLEGLHAARPRDARLRSALVKAHAAHGFVVWETLALGDVLRERPSPPALARALRAYARAVEHGLAFLADRGVPREDLLASMRGRGGVPALLGERLDRGDRTDREAVLYLAQAMGGTVRHRRGSPAHLAWLPVAKGLFDWACAGEADPEGGICDIFYGSYEAGIPRMLGGNPEKGRRIFERAIRRHPRNWLARTAFVEHYAVPMGDRGVWEEQKAALEKAVRLFEEDRVWRPGRERDEALRDPDLGAFQAVAVERFRTMRRHERELFR